MNAASFPHRTMPRYGSAGVLGKYPASLRDPDCASRSHPEIRRHGWMMHERPPSRPGRAQEASGLARANPSKPRVAARPRLSQPRPPGDEESSAEVCVPAPAVLVACESAGVLADGLRARRGKPLKTSRRCATPVVPTAATRKEDRGACRSRGERHPATRRGATPRVLMWYPKDRGSAGETEAHPEALAKQESIKAFSSRRSLSRSDIRACAFHEVR